MQSVGSPELVDTRRIVDDYSVSESEHLAEEALEEVAWALRDSQADALMAVPNQAHCGLR